MSPSRDALHRFKERARVRFASVPHERASRMEWAAGGHVCEARHGSGKRREGTVILVLRRYGAEEQFSVWMTRVRVDVFDRAELDQVARRQDADLIGHLRDDPEVMADEQDRC